MIAVTFLEYQTLLSCFSGRKVTTSKWNLRCFLKTFIEFGY